MNQMLIEHLDPAAWKAKPPGQVRTIAAIFTHKCVRLATPHLKIPAQLDRAHSTRRALRGDACRSARRW
ncbi:MAG: hypothetical protein WBE37_21680 [Bryobacteraceae bacterium]